MATATACGSVQIEKTMGATYIGVVSAGILYGVTFMQTWYYLIKYRQDVWYIKSLVVTLWTFETVHQVLICHAVYYYLIRHFGDPSALANLVWSILLEVLFNSCIALIVQGFLLMRVWKLSNRNILLTSVIGCSVVAGFGCSVVFTIESMKLVTWMDLRQLKALSMAVNLLGAVTDILITAALFYFLHISRTGFKKTNKMINKLIAFTVKTGFLTSVCSIASLISILAFGHTLTYVAFYFCLGRLYSNSMLATLNARKMMRQISESTDGLSLSVEKAAQGICPKSKVPTQIEINIDTVQEFREDPCQMNVMYPPHQMADCCPNRCSFSSAALA